MKGDMAGGAAVLEATGAIAELGLPVRVLTVAAASENMPSGHAYRPGDIITAANGKTIEITNTDAEGRLVLADALWYAREQGATHLVDFATLTGAMERALGDLYAGVFGNDRFGYRLNVGGMKAHAALKDEFGATPWWHGGGSLEWELEPDRAAQRANVEQLQAWGYAAEWIDLKQVRELEPDINPDVIGDAPVAYFPEEGWLDPVVYAHAMLSAAQRRHGAKIVCGAKVVDLLMTGDRASGVRLADG